MQKTMVSQDYDVPKKPTFFLNDMEVVQSSDAAAYSSNNVTDNVMYSTNGVIGLRHCSEIETIGFETEVMLNGVYHCVERGLADYALGSPGDTHSGATICAVNLDCFIDGESGTLSRIPTRCLSLSDGAYRSTCADVLSSDGGLTFDASYIRCVSTEDVNVWTAEVSYTNFRMHTTPEDSSDTDIGSPLSGQWSNGPVPKYKLEFVATFAVDVDDWEVLQANQMDAIWQRSLTSGVLVSSTTDVFCTLEQVKDGKLEKVQLDSELTISACDSAMSSQKDYAGTMHRNNTSEYGQPRTGPMSTSMGQRPCMDIMGGLNSHLCDKRFFVITRRFIYTVVADRIPQKLVLSFSGRHSNEESPVIPLEAPCIEDTVALRRTQLDEFWETYHIDIQLQEEVIPNRTRLPLLYNAFCLYSVSQGLAMGLPRCGLSSPGEGLRYDLSKYVYFGIYYTLTRPINALRLLRSLHGLLPAARANAVNIFCLTSGAIFPACTMTGSDGDSFSPTYTVRVAVNAEVGYLVCMYLSAAEAVSAAERATLLELLIETGRVWPQLGEWSDNRTVFRLDNIAGTDMYNGGSCGNFYIHLSAREHLRSIQAQLRLHEKLLGAPWVDAQLRRLEVTAEERAEWAAVASCIALHASDEHGVYPVHDYFDALPDWRGDRPRHPLALNYHPLAVYRAKLVDIPEVLLGMYLYHENFEEHEYERNFTYYAPLCTLDSPEGLGILAITQCRARHNFAQPIPYLRALGNLDLDNILYSADEGLHLCAMASSLLTVISGLGGVRWGADSISLNPILPAGVSCYSFSVCWRGAVLKTSVDNGHIVYELLSGDSLRFIHGPGRHRIHLHTGFRRCEANRQLSIPRISRSRVSQFDGVVVLVESVFDNIYEYNYVAWYRTLERLFENYRTLHNRVIPPLTAEEFIEKVIYQQEEEEIAFSGIHNVLLSRQIELDLGTPNDAEIVETRYGLANAKVAEMSEMIVQRPPPVDEGLFALLKDFGRNGVALAVVTYSRSLKSLTAAVPALGDLFIASIDGEEAHDRRIRSRPHLDLFLCAAEKIHVEPAHCLVISHHLDRGYKAEDMGRFRMFLDVDNPFVSTRVQPRPYPTLNDDMIEQLGHDNPVVCRLTKSNMPTTLDNIEDLMEGRRMRNPLVEQAFSD